MQEKRDGKHHVVIVGGGFAGLNAARELMHTPTRVTLIDKRNFHLFQPLLYQVATGSLSPGDIAYPLRWIVAGAKNIQMLAAEAVDILPDEQTVILQAGEVRYDSLILATGSIPNFYGHDEVEESLLGLKTVEDALDIRRQILLAFEAAEQDPDPAQQRAWQHFIIVGGGATGVELAGAIAELAKETLKGEFQRIDPGDTQITLLEAADRLLYPILKDLSDKAEKALTSKGVTVRKGTSLVEVRDGLVTVCESASEKQEQLSARTVLWAAGVKGSPVGEFLARRTGAQLDHLGRIVVNPNLSIPGYPNLLVVGDLAHFSHQTTSPLPGVAQVAMQQGSYAARLVLARLEGQEIPPFRYKNRGTMAVIGRNAAVADLGALRLSGFIGWLIWAFIHIGFLIGFDNKLLVFIQWAWNYLTHKRGARLIVGEPRNPFKKAHATAVVSESNPIDKNLLWENPWAEACVTGESHLEGGTTAPSNPAFSRLGSFNPNNRGIG